MCILRRMIRSHKATSDTAADRSVREAEAIVHRSWIDQLTERRQEVEAAIRRAAARCETAQRSLTAAQRSGDPQKIATSRRDLEKAVQAARKTTLAWERTCHLLSTEAGLTSHRKPGARPES